MARLRRPLQHIRCRLYMLVGLIEKKLKINKEDTLSLPRYVFLAKVSSLTLSPDPAYSCNFLATVSCSTSRGLLGSPARPASGPMLVFAACEREVELKLPMNSFLRIFLFFFFLFLFYLFFFDSTYDLTGIDALPRASDATIAFFSL